MPNIEEESKFLLALVFATLILGIVVLLFKSDYRIDKIWESNKDYYPSGSAELRLKFLNPAPSTGKVSSQPEDAGKIPEDAVANKSSQTNENN